MALLCTALLKDSDIAHGRVTGMSLLSLLHQRTLILSNVSVMSMIHEIRFADSQNKLAMVETFFCVINKKDIMS